MILHITNDYSGSTVYMNLVRELDNLGIPQIIYNPVREEKRIGKNAISFKTKGTKIIYRPILNYQIDRYLYPYKIQKIVKDIQQKVDMTQVAFIHAHTWYSDGGVAYKLHKKYNIPFCVTIRNTDINLFQNKLKYVRPFGRTILKSAAKVILISAAYKNRILSQSSLQSIKKELNNKIAIIPNGVDPFWIQNNQPKQDKTTKEILYIGKFTAGKNILKLVQAVIHLNQTGYSCQLNLVGGDGKMESAIKELIAEYPKFITYHGKVYDKEKLLSIYRSNAIFAMPSKNETFGLVYVEAMLQGLPILYTKDEGIDGFYNKTIGERVHKNAEANDIEEALKTLFKEYGTYQISTQALLKNHDWHLIAQEYQKIYHL